MIRVSGLSFRHPQQPAHVLNGVDFHVPSGQFVLLSGPTGCGKSTIGLILCGAIPNLFSGELSGSVLVNGKNVTEQAIRETAKSLGFLLQNVEHQTFTDNVTDEVAFSLENFCVDSSNIDAKIEQVLALVNGEHLLGRSINTLSAGERQRVMLAALLAMDQNVLVLDEPLAYLDVDAQQAFVDLMLRLSQSGKTILCFEHRRDAIKGVVDREIYMHSGGIQAEPVAQTAFQAVSTYVAKEPVLTFEGVSFGWGKDAKTQVLNEVTFEVRQHESVVLLGSNGSGKTTIMNLAMGLAKPLSGSISNCGYSIEDSSVSDIAKFAAFIFQRPDHQLYLPYVDDEIHSQAVDAEAVRAELTALGLDGLERRHPKSLSMGQKRRLTLAAALARQPKVMLLDEPSVGQDDASLAMIIRRLDRYLLEGGALLTATHDTRVAHALAHRVLKLINGCIEESYERSQEAAAM